MIVTGLMFVGVTVIVKYVGSELPAAEGAFLRYLSGLVFLIPMIRPIMAAHLTRRQVKLFAVRGVFLGESLPPRRLAAVVAALIGAVIILRPGVREVDPGHIAMLFTALAFAAGYLIAKQMSGEVSAAVVVGMLSITVTIGLAPFAYAVWVTPTLAQVGWMFLVACFATAGHYTMTLAFAAAPLTVTQPVTFLQLVWAVVLGAVLFGEGIDGWVILGGAVIMASVSFITWREAVARRAITPAVAQTKV